jgi:TRAP-type C4-dicarboxylate transport system permease small subunit
MFFSSLLDVLKKINRELLRAAGWGVVLGMAVIGVLVPYEVAGRYFLGSMPAWTGEVTIFVLAWVSMLGAAVGLPRGYQIGMTFFLDLLPPGISRYVQILGYLAGLCFLAVLVVYGFSQVLVNVRQTSPAMQISMALPYLAIPVGSLLMWLVTFEQVLETLLGKEKLLPAKNS